MGKFTGLDGKLSVAYFGVPCIEGVYRSPRWTSFMASTSTTHVKVFSVDSIVAVFGNTMAQGYGAGIASLTSYTLKDASALVWTREPKAFLSTVLFDSPAPQKMTCLVKVFRTGKVSVIRLGGGLGESSMEATHLDSSDRSAWPGNSEQV
jgi:hypothetical protein